MNEDSHISGGKQAWSFALLITKHRITSLPRRLPRRLPRHHLLPIPRRLPRHLPRRPRRLLLHLLRRTPFQGAFRLTGHHHLLGERYSLHHHRIMISSGELVGIPLEGAAAAGCSKRNLCCRSAAEGFDNIQADSQALVAPRNHQVQDHRRAVGSDRSLHRSLHHSPGWEIGRSTVLDRPAADKETLQGSFHATRWWAVGAREAAHMARRVACRVGVSTTGAEACRSRRHSTKLYKSHPTTQSILAGVDEYLGSVLEAASSLAFREMNAGRWRFGAKIETSPVVVSQWRLFIWSAAQCTGLLR